MAKKKAIQQVAESPAISKEVDVTQPGFSNVKQGNPQTKMYVRKEALPSQINTAKV